ncbi:MAG: OsmC family peroxiredoxin [Leptolyngbyaceae cyanobacterium SU_3_3]|nr:OsmC family peroxiredoxin [Leptolyngbyaceae cyanobacterium SU_3_3]
MKTIIQERRAILTTEDKTHLYQVEVTWTGNTGQGTAGYKTYERSHEISGTGKPVISGSSDGAFRGDRTKYNPEELLVASLSTCHMLCYLHLCAEEQLVVTRYIDHPVGKMIETDDGSGRFAEVILKPTVTVREGANLAMTEQLHEKAHHLCFIANSMNFPVRCKPLIETEHAI